MSDTTSFFIAGGTLPLDSPAYVKRPADDELFYLLQAHEFCYVLTPRQMGKSSLMVRTAQQLQNLGSRTAIVDLTHIGTNVSMEQWYSGILISLQSQLFIQTDAQTWWMAHQNLGVVQRLAEFLHDVVLSEVPENIVIFIDEIDSTLTLDFSDDFFAAVRYIYNARAELPNYERLTFALFGVATPSDLVKDKTRTPFNIGHRINLREFSQADGRVLERGLITSHPGRGAAIFDRIYYWTSGHPYLTQRLCLTIAESTGQSWRDEEVDTLVADLFFSDKSRRETNLQFIREYISRSPQKAKLVQLYDRVYRGKQVIDDEHSLEQNQLKLVGLLCGRSLQDENVIGDERILDIPNRIYRHAFNKTWIRANSPVNWTARIALIVLVVILMLAGVVFRFIQVAQPPSASQQASAAQQIFEDTANSAVRLTNLSKIFQLAEIEKDQAIAAIGYELFNELSPADRLALFSEQTRDLSEEIYIVAKAVSKNLDNTAEGNALLVEMIAALDQSEDFESQELAQGFVNWQNSRAALENQNYSRAERDLQAAIRRLADNPYLYFEHAQALIGLGEYQEAAADLDQLLLITAADPTTQSKWQAAIQTMVMDTSPLHTLLAGAGAAANWPQLLAFVDLPPATPTATSTETTVVPTSTPSATMTPTPIPTATPNPTDTATAVPSSTPTSTPSSTPTPTATNRPVVVTGSGLPFNFSTFGSWARGDEPYGTFTQASSPSRGGSSGRLEYDFTGSTTPYDYVIFTQFHAISGQPNALQIWVYGNNSGHFLNAWIVDGQNEIWQVSFGRINHTDWKQLTGYIVEGQPWPWTHISGPDNGRVDYPIRFHSLVLDSPNASGQGIIFVDDLTAVTLNDAPTPVYDN